MSQSTTQFIDVVVNGELQRVLEGLTITGLLHSLHIEAERVAVELNRSIVRQPDWQRTPVKAGAQLEIVQFVGGG